jgi:hypothetical protein
VLGIGLAALEAQRGESIIKFIGAALWFAVSGIAFTSLRTLAQIPDTEPVANSGTRRSDHTQGGQGGEAPRCSSVARRASTTCWATSAMMTRRPLRCAGGPGGADGGQG